MNGFKVCPVCGKEFGHSFKKSRLEKAVCCSASCRQRLKADPVNKTTLICVICGKSFEAWASRNRSCCSRKCASALNGRKSKPSLQRPDSFRTVYCEQCSTPYTVHVSQITLRHSRFCSRACQSKWVSENRVGVNHPNYIGGARYRDRGRNWSMQRKLTLQRDDYTCQVCGLRRQDSPKLTIHVHHITPYREFNGDYLEANRLSNLITLCHSCHVQVEQNKIPCPIPKSDP